jgi:excisionase family DNA binding protein
VGHAGDDAELFTVQEAADHLRVPVTSVRHWIRHGELEAVPLPNHGTCHVYRIHPDTLECLLVPPHNKSGRAPIQPIHQTAKEQAL